MTQAEAAQCLFLLKNLSESSRTGLTCLEKNYLLICPSEHGLEEGGREIHTHYIYIYLCKIYIHDIIQ